MIILYRIGLGFYFFFLRLAALFGHKKAGQYVHALNKHNIDLQHITITGKKTAWFHAASAGEWLQLSPLAHIMAADGWEIIVSFFSPSAIPFIEKESFAYFMLPPDTLANANKLYQKIQPAIFITARYEYWPFLFEFLNKENIPTVLLNTYVPESISFWKEMWWKKYLKYLSLVCCIDELTAIILRELGAENVAVTGDTKADQRTDIFVVSPHLIEAFSGKKILIAGSAHEKEISLLLQFLEKHIKDFPEWKWLIVPHEPSYEEYQKLLTKKSISYMDANEARLSSTVVYVNQTGILSALYRYSSVTFIGGGWNKGVHNLLEAAAQGNLLLFGPKYHNFPEADILQKEGCGISINKYAEFESKLLSILNDMATTKELANKAATLVNSMRGATDRCYSEIKMLLQ